MIVAISGTPCVGKTAVAEGLAKKIGYKLIKVNDLADEIGAYDGYDRKRRSKILDMRKLRRKLSHIAKQNKNLIIEGHVAHDFPCDVCIVLRCNPKELRKRLKKRYGDFQAKIDENAEAEMLGVITSEALMNIKNVYEVETADRTVEQNVNDILKIMEGKTKGYEVGRIDYLEV